MDEDEESLPIFRHFTREDLAIIENVIFENKLREKKKEERRQQNIKKYGEGARARKMYENDSEDEEEDEAEMLQPNPKLEQGGNLPRRYEDFPLELANVPLCDIDPYYSDKRTFIVISKSKAIYRFSARPAFFLISPFHPIRRLAIMVLTHPLYNTLIMATILTNCYVMIEPETEYTAATEIVFTAIYTYEAIVKLTSRGLFIDGFTYLRDGWNWLDFSVIMLSYVTIAIDLGNFSAIKTFRVFRALKSVAVVPGLKTIVGAIVYSVKNLRDVIILTLFALAIFALIGLQLYMGVLTQICISDLPANTNVTWFDHMSNESSWYIHPDLENYVICGNSSGAGKCPLGTTCLAGFGPNPNYGYTNYDNFATAYLTAFRLMTQDFWEHLYQITLRATGPMHITFFIFNILLGSFYLVNLILAIVAMSYDELNRNAEIEAQREQEEMEAIAATEAAALAEAEAAAEEAIAAQMLDLGDDQENDDVDPDSNPDSGRVQSNDNSTKTASTLKAGGQNSQNSSLGSLDHDVARENGSANTLKSNGVSRNNLRNASATTQDIRVLVEVVDSVTSDTGGLNGWEEDDEDDDEKLKRIIKEKLSYGCNVLCVWDCSRFWIRISEVLSFIVFDAFTEVFITLCILVNVIFMALDHYFIEYDPLGCEKNCGMSPFMTNMLTTGNYFFTAVFAVESFAKLAAMSPKYFFSDNWNVFDFLIVILSLVELLFEGVEGLSMLRSFRLLRVFKLAKSWKSLNDILQIMANSLGALSYLTFVLLIIIFIFAVMGNQLFKQKYLDNVCNKEWACVMPRWHFVSFFMSFMIVFRVLCGEWIESMWDCMHVAGPACVPYFLATVLIANLVILNLFLALLLSSFSDMGQSNADDGEPDKIQIAFQRIGRFKRWIISKFKRKKVSSARDDTLKNGHVKHQMNGIQMNGVSGGTVIEKPPATSMTNGDALAPLPQPPPTAHNDDMQLFDKFQAKIGHGMDVDIPPKYDTSGDDMHRKFLNGYLNGGYLITEGDKEINGSYTMSRETPEENNDEEEYWDDYEPDQEHAEVYFYPGDEVQDCCPAVIYRVLPCMAGDEASPFWEAWNRHRLLGSRLIENTYFEGVVLALILISSFVMTLEDVYFSTRPTLQDGLFYLDRILTVVFFIETVLKLFSMGFIAYFRNAWCWLDFVIVAVSLINFAASLLGAGNIAIFKTMRTLRALRPLRAMAKMEGMKVVVNALIGALPSIFNVLMVCIIFWLIFAIIGVNLFMGRYYKCINTETGERYSHEMIPNRTVCMLEKERGEPADWVNSNINFDNTGMAYLSLMQIATWKGWVDVMYDAIDSRDIGQQPQYENKIYMYGYFVLFIVAGSFFTLNLLVGVIIDKFNEQKNKGGSSLDAFMTEDQRKYLAAMKKATTKKPLKALPRPSWRPQAIVFGIITNKKFDMIIMAFIGLNMITMMCDHFQQSRTVTMILENLNLFFVVIFTAEMLLKMFALRHHYFAEPWNLFDFFIVCLSLASVFLKDLISEYFVSPTLLRVVRVVKVARILRLIKGAKGIRTLLFSLVMAFPALINIALLLSLIMFIFAVFGMSMFKDVKIIYGFDDVHNFQTFFKTFTLLFQMCTSAGWAETFIAISNEEDCAEGNEDIGFAGDCGSFPTASAYMMLYLTLSFLIIVNMYIAVILENYTQATEDVSEGITDEDYELFYEIWQEFDPEGTMYIPYDQLSDFMDCLEPPLQIPKPNKYKIIHMDIPIIRATNPETKEVKDSMVYSADILDVLTQDFFARKSKQLTDDEHAMPHINEVKPDKNSTKRNGYEQVSSTMERQREKYCASLIKSAWRHHNIDKVNASARGRRLNGNGSGGPSGNGIVEINGGRQPRISQPKHFNTFPNAR